jgi:hypothetical protein
MRPLWNVGAMAMAAPRIEGGDVKSAWGLDTKIQLAPSGLPKTQLEHVLVEYDGPLVATRVTPDKRRFLAVAVDESDDGDVVRWIHSEISPLEFDALVSGGVTVRDALIKGHVYIIDRIVDGGEISKAWYLGEENVPEVARPEPGSFLPPSVIGRLAPKLQGGSFIKIDGKSVSER